MNRTLRRADADAGPAAVRPNLTQRLDADLFHPSWILAVVFLFIPAVIGMLPAYERYIGCPAPSLEQGGCGFYLTHHGQSAYTMHTPGCQIDMGTAARIEALPSILMARAKGYHRIEILAVPFSDPGTEIHNEFERLYRLVP